MPALDVLAHRVVWLLVFFLAILGPRGRLREVVPLLHPRQLPWVALALAMIPVTWFLFIRAVGQARETETSLGHFIFPPVSVTLAVTFGV